MLRFQLLLYVVKDKLNSCIFLTLDADLFIQYNVMKTRFVLLALLGLLVSQPQFAQLDLDYQNPPETLAAIVDAPATPGTSLNVDAGVMLILDRPGYAGIDDLAQEMLRLAGTRIDPATNGPSRAGYSIGITVLNLKSGEKKKISGLPANPKIGGISWSPTHTGFVFTQTLSDGIELWYVGLEDLKPKKLLGSINGLMGSSTNWMPDNHSGARWFRPIAAPVPNRLAFQKDLS